MDIKDRIKQLRNEKNLTMDMLAYDMSQQFQIDINKGLISKWENGKNDPSLKHAKCLSIYFDVSLDYLIGLTDIRTPSRLLAYSRGFKKIKEERNADK